MMVGKASDVCASAEKGRRKGARARRTLKAKEFIVVGRWFISYAVYSV